jgi:undecaprenyl-diphosphatase
VGPLAALQALDEAILRLAHGGPPWAVSAFVAFTMLGTGWGALLLLPFLFRQQSRHATLWLAANLALTGCIVNLLKLAVGRPRPCSTLAWCSALGVAPPRSPSFPSGHAASAFAFAAFVAAKQPRLAAPAFVCATLVAWSRCALGVHYPSDVLCGALLGAAIGLACARASARPARAPHAPALPAHD